MQWYLMRTWAGKEEELVREICRTVPGDWYHECFVIYQERIWRKQQRSIVHRELLFPGCVFLTSEDREKMAYAARVLNRISPQMGEVFSIMREDAAFLERLSGEEHVVKLSSVMKDEQGRICRLSGPLKVCQGEIERMQLKKRYAMVRHRLWGEEQVIVLGIVLKEDENRVVFLESLQSLENAKIPAEAMA